MMRLLPSRTLAALLLTIALVWPWGAMASEVRVAVAANFTQAAKEIARAFEAKTGIKARLSFGSTGKLYAQIVNGAPFDVFLSADAERPRRLEQEDRIIPGTRFAYATGRLVLWSPDEGLVTEDMSALKNGTFRRLAIANPKTAPYGKAAMTVMQTLGVLADAQRKIVRGNNIAQTYQFVVSGNADLGFIAASQASQQPKGSRWIVPARLHAPLTQEAVALANAADPALARAFTDFLASPETQAMIASFGYAAEN